MLANLKHLPRIPRFQLTGFSFVLRCDLFLLKLKMNEELDISSDSDDSCTDIRDILEKKNEQLRILQEMVKNQEEGIATLNNTKKPKQIKSRSEKTTKVTIDKSYNLRKRKVTTSFSQILIRSPGFQNSPEKPVKTEEGPSVTPCVPRDFIPNDYGPVPGVEVGDHWDTRIQCSAAGVHRPTVAGIHAGPEGAYSVALSGGYPEDVDNGDSFIYTGAGGRDLKGTSTKPKNLRVAPQTKDQELTRTNASLLMSISTKKPIRVIRGYKSPGFYAPELGYRYDGLYQVVDYWADVGATGFRVYRFLMERIKDQDPPPWETQGLKFANTKSDVGTETHKNETVSARTFDSEFKENVKPENLLSKGSPTQVSFEAIHKVDTEIFLQIKSCIEKSGDSVVNLKENCFESLVENFTGWDQS